ncbi:uncharacterized protein LOC143194360 [Rhynchophorus ferrugineus]|uniref:Uncharacterized protein n=1 Tax=Rhynchophorus ferrugineus TaxID=354439 RepID=A0A834MCA8_RHYFE|nr:hypothetical protein GWI33_010385 [Rhynchophorus ferrugineus]KAF7276391.1 hypothetical protein GWI33_010370 [Rhynchophorus ferrugineus]
MDPDAPIFTPPSRNTLKNSLRGTSASSTPNTPKEPQCSRYSRRSVRQQTSPTSPRPILGAKMPFPRPILGRKEEPARDDADDYIGKEFRNMNRSFQRLKLKEESMMEKNREESCT